MPKLVIADPSLSDHRGHHYLLTSLVSEAAIDAGLDVIWLVNRDFEIKTVDQSVEINTAYSFTMYDKYRAVSDDTIKLKTSLETANEIFESLTRIGLTEDDHVLFHTAYYDIFEAIVHIYSTEEAAPAPVVHLCTPYDEKTMPGRPDDKSVPKLLKQLADLSAIEKRVFLWAETPQLANHYREMLGVIVYALPLPVAKKVEMENLVDSVSQGALINIVYLGAAREEKGFTLLPELVSLCYENDKTRGNVQFTIQATPQIVGYNERILEAIGRLKGFGNNFVKLIQHSLDESTYHELLWQSEIVLLLYDEHNYKIRGSGIAVEAVSLGKCLIASKRTFCESLIDRGGGVGAETPLEAFMFIEQYIDQRGLFRTKGRQQAFFYNIQNSGQRYIDRLIYRNITGNRTWVRPSERLRQFAPFLVQ